MIVLSAIFRAKPGKGDAMQTALDEMTAHVIQNERGTVGRSEERRVGKECRL